MNRKPVLSCITLACLLALSLLACKRQDGEQASPVAVVPEQNAPPAPASAPAPEQPAVMPDKPTLQVATLDGKPFDLAAHRGNWVVVNFWATWCAPCLKEMPELSALDAMREHIEVLGLAYQEITPAELRQFLEKHPVVYPVAIVDVYDPPADFATPRGLPMTYLIAPDGKVAKRFLGPVTARDIEDAIAAKGGPRAGDPAAGTTKTG